MSALHPFAQGPVTASTLANSLGAVLHGDDLMVHGVAALEHADRRSLAWFAGRKLPIGCGAGVLLTHLPIEGRTCLVVSEPLRAFGVLLRRAFPESLDEGVHPAATVHATAVLASGVVVSAGCVVGAHVEIGEDTVLFPNVTVYAHTVVGARCRVHAGAILGSDGFRYAPGTRGPERVPQLGRLVLEDDVEVGANTCVDRGGLGETRIGAGSKLDNLVQVGHNSQLGRAVVIAGQAGLAGSVTVGDGAQIGGQAGIADHRSIGAGARVGAQSGVSRDVAAGETVLGTPAMAARLVRRMWAGWRRQGR